MEKTHSEYVISYDSPLSQFVPFSKCVMGTRPDGDAENVELPT